MHFEAILSGQIEENNQDQKYGPSENEEEDHYKDHCKDGLKDTIFNPLKTSNMITKQKKRIHQKTKIEEQFCNLSLNKSHEEPSMTPYSNVFDIDRMKISETNDEFICYLTTEKETQKKMKNIKLFSDD